MQQLSSATELLDVQLPDTLIESPSVSTFLPEEDASICPLLLSNNTNGSTTPLAFSHPLTPCGLADSDGGGVDGNCDADETKLETGSSSGSSTGHGLEMVADSAASSLFNKHAAYQHLHLQNNNLPVQDGHLVNSHNGHAMGNGKEAPPSFVSWNWPVIRKCTFFIFMSSLFAMCALVVAMIVTMPKFCNPETAWYRGRVFYEIFPASFQDSNNDGTGDLRGISSRIDYLVELGVSAVRLNSIFPSPNYPEDYEQVTSLTEVAEVLGHRKDVRKLAASLHAHNISLILDLNVQSFWNELLIDVPSPAEPSPVTTTTTTTTTTASTTPTTTTTTKTPKTISTTTTTASASLTLTANTEQHHTNESVAEPVVGAVMSPPAPPPLRQNLISAAIRQWVSLGVDGFYIKGLEHVPLGANIQLSRHLAEWQRILGPFGILILHEKAYYALSPDERQAVRPHLDLIDVSLEMLDGAKAIDDRLALLLKGELEPSDKGLWLHWSIGGVNRERLTTRQSSNFTLAATLLQLMLPGTPSIFYGDEIALTGAVEPSTGANDGDDTIAEQEVPHINETQHLQHLTTMQWAHEATTTRLSLPWLPQRTNYDFGNLETIIAMIQLRRRSPSIYKNFICKLDVTQGNTEIRRSHDDILIVERSYPRRNSFVSVTNFGTKRVRLDMSSMFYSGIAMLRSGVERGDKVFFDHFEIGPMQTIVVKLDK